MMHDTIKIHMAAEVLFRIFKDYRDILLALEISLRHS